MQLRKGRKRSVILNVTSLIDVLFLLLIFFMVSATFLSTPAIKLELPKAEHADQVRAKPLVIYVNPTGQTFLNDEPVNMALLQAALKTKIAESEDGSVTLKADSRVSHGKVVEIMDIAKGAGARKLIISTDPKDGK